MPRLNIRISEDLQSQMNRSERNWSEVVRRRIREELGREDTPLAERNIGRLVRQHENDLLELWVLHMFAEGIGERRVYETAELIFGENCDKQINELREQAEEKEVSLELSDIIKQEIAMNGRSKIVDAVKSNIQNAERELKEGIYLLSHYLTDKFDSDSGFINQPGFERTWGIYSDIEEPAFDRIIATGLVYKNYYSSNAYGHPWPKIPAYGLEILEDIRANPASIGMYDVESSIGEIIERSDVRTFLRWLKGSSKTVDRYREDDEMDELAVSSGLQPESIDQAITDLIRSNSLYIDFYPGRSSTGGRSSMPGRWQYQLTESCLSELSTILLEEL